MGNQVVKMGSSIRENQAEFFDDHPPLYPWPRLLRKHGLRRLFKPREAFWARAWQRMGIRPGARVADIGCGTGIWIDRLAEEYQIEGFGIDVSMDSLVSAKQETNSNGQFSLADAYSLPFPNDEFDVVLSLDTLEHVQDHRAFIEELQRVTSPGGTVFLWSINRNQRWTWNWLLDRIGIDIYDRVAHDPEMMPHPVAVREMLGSSGTAALSLEYFNAFFTLILDELIMISTSLLKRTELFAREGWTGTRIGELYLWIAHQLTRLSWQVLNKLDTPWHARGMSNGFLLIAEQAEKTDSQHSLPIELSSYLEEPLAAEVPHMEGGD